MGEAERIELSLRAKIAPLVPAVGALIDGISKVLKDHGLSETARRRILIAIEEVVVNAATHRMEPAKGPIDFRLSGTSEALVATIAYDGAEFDTSAPPDRAAPRPNELGGHGLNLAQTFASKIRHRYESGRNHVRLEFNTKR